MGGARKAWCDMTRQEQVEAVEEIYRRLHSRKRREALWRVLHEFGVDYGRYYRALKKIRSGGVEEFMNSPKIRLGRPPLLNLSDAEAAIFAELVEGRSILQAVELFIADERCSDHHREVLSRRIKEAGKTGGKVAFPKALRDIASRSKSERGEARELPILTASQLRRSTAKQRAKMLEQIERISEDYNTPLSQVLEHFKLAKATYYKWKSKHADDPVGGLVWNKPTGRRAKR